MALRISYMALFSVFLLTWFEPLYAGKYEYHAATNTWKEKKQTFRVVLSKEKAKPKKTLIDEDSQDHTDPAWVQFYETRDAIDNLNLWLIQFVEKLSFELATLEATEAVAGGRLDYRIHHAIVQRKIEVLTNEIARPPFRRHLWQRSLTDKMKGALKSAYDAKYQLYTELNDDAHTAYITAKIAETVDFLAPLHARNLEEREALQHAASDEAPTLEKLETLREQIEKDHKKVKRLLKNVVLADVKNPGSHEVLQEDKYEHICENYVAIIEDHQNNVQAIRRLIDDLQQQMANVAESLPDESSQEPHDYRAAAKRTLTRAGIIAATPFVVAAAGVLVPVKGIERSYDKTKEKYADYRAERQRRKEQHQAFSAHAQSSFHDLLPHNLSEGDSEIYERSFAQFAQRKYRYRDMDFAASALDDAETMVKQSRRLAELDEALRLNAERQDLPAETLVKIHKALKQARKTVNHFPELSSDDQFAPKNIIDRILSERAEKQRRLEEHEKHRAAILEKRAATLSAQRAEREQTKVKTQEAKTKAREKAEKQRQQDAIDLERRMQARARYQSLKEELHAKYLEQIVQGSFDENNAEALMLNILRRESGRKRSFSNAYTEIFGDSTLKDMTATVDGTTFHDFWTALTSKYSKQADAYIERRNTDQKRAANARRNLNELRRSGKEVQKPDVDDEAREMVRAQFLKGLGNTRKKRDARHRFFGDTNLNNMLASHDTFDSFLTALNMRFLDTAKAIIAKRNLERQKAANREANLLALQLRMKDIHSISEADRNVRETLVALLVDNVHDRAPAHRHDVFGGTNLSVFLENNETLDSVLDALAAQYEAGVEGFIRDRIAERKRAENRARNLQALSIAAKEAQEKSDTEQATRETLLVLAFEELTKKAGKSKSSQGIFGQDNLGGMLEDHDSFEEFSTTLNKRYEQNVLAFQAKRDQQLLLSSAKEGLSKKGVTKFREGVLKDLGAEFAKISSAFEIPDAWATEESPKKKASSATPEFETALRELLANQDEYEKAIQATGSAEQRKPDHDDTSEANPFEQEDDDVIELGEEDIREHFWEWYASFPSSLATPVHIASDCLICCSEALNYDLEFSSKEHLNVAPGLILQTPKPGAHKLSVCGHMFCESCLHNIEVRAKKIRTAIKMGESMLIPFVCPLCKAQIPFHELNKQKFEDTFGKPMSSTTAN